VSVKPLTLHSLNHLMDRIDNARDGKIRSLTPLSPTRIDIIFSVQDVARGYDWIEILFRLEGVNDAKLVNDHVLRDLDMSEGITVELDAKRCAFAIGSYVGRVNEAPFYMIGTSLGYQERPFNG